jgi:predicted ABC-type ATPase
MLSNLLLAEPKFIEYDPIPSYLEGEAKAIIEKSLNSSHSTSKPTLIHLLGIPGSGKTTYATKLLNTVFTSYSLVQFDSVMESLAGYQNDKKQFGLVNAFTNWELPARAIGYHLLQALVENSRDVLFDHSASFPSHLQLISKIKEKGYKVEMHRIECPPLVAVKRVKDREKIIERHTPEALIWERETILEKLIPRYKLIVDKFTTVAYNQE